MKQGEFRYFKRTKFIQFLDIQGTNIHTVPLDQFGMQLRIVKDDPDEPEFRYFFYTINGAVEVDGVTYHEVEEFFAKGE
jgi:hypothetical protein